MKSLQVLSSAAGLLMLVGASATAQTNFTLLKSFNGSDGAVPFGTLMEGRDGALYGTTVTGGSSNSGTVFMLNKDGSGYVVLKSFSGADGRGPYAGLVEGANGALYGTTYAGGAADSGTVFKLNKDGGNCTVLHSFLGSGDGKNLRAALIRGKDGALYGGTIFADSTTRGTVFKLDEDGSNYRILHTFTGSPDGQEMQSTLLQGTDGALYGTTVAGGSGVLGTVFKLNTDGSGYSVLKNLTGRGEDGAFPSAAVIEGSDGALYGTTESGGSSRVGTIFKLNKDGSGYVVLHSFSATGGDGQRPYGELVEGSDGVLYGTTGQGGSGSYHGTIFKLNKDGSGYTVLRTFTGTIGDGDTPGAGLLRGSDGVLYGTTEYGGDGAGCVFAFIIEAIRPRVKALSVSSNSILVQFLGTSGIQYEVQRSTDLASWAVLGTPTASIDGSFSFTDFSPLRSAFYRLEQH